MYGFDFCDEIDNADFGNLRKNQEVRKFKNYCWVIKVAQLGGMTIYYSTRYIAI